MRAKERKAPKQRAAQPLASSRLTSKGQATIPRRVREKLNLLPGDRVLFEETDEGIVGIRKAESLDLEFLLAVEKTLSEWDSENDTLAYRDL